LTQQMPGHSGARTRTHPRDQRRCGTPGGLRHARVHAAVSMCAPARARACVGSIDSTSGC
jgi:hypothetical protein